MMRRLERSTQTSHIDTGAYAMLILGALLILIFLLLVSAQIHEPYYANYIAGGV